MSPISRVAFSAFLLLFTVGVIVAPAQALLPIVGAVGGIAVRGVVGGVAKRVWIPLSKGVNQPNKWNTAANALFGLAIAHVALSDGNENDKLYLRPTNGHRVTVEPTEDIKPKEQTLVFRNSNNTGPYYSSADAWRAAQFCTNGLWTCPAGTGWSTTSYSNIPDEVWAGGYGGQPPTAAGDAGACTSAPGMCNWAVYQIISNLRWYATGNRAVSSMQEACPAGYTEEGGQCKKKICPANYTLVAGPPEACVENFPDDGLLTYEPDTGDFLKQSVGDPNNPAVGAPAPFAAPYEWDGFDEHGNRVRIRVQPRPDGGLDITTFTQGITNGQPSTTRNKLQISPDGVPTVESSDHPGPIETVDVQTPPDPITPGDPIEFPDDYAREPTQQQVRDKLISVDTTTKEIRDGLKGDPTGAFEPATTAAQAAEDALKAVPDQVVGDKASTAWGFTLALPTGCTNPPAIVFPKWSIDPDLCQHQGIIHTAMSFPWAFLTLTVCVGLVRRTLG